MYGRDCIVCRDGERVFSRHHTHNAQEPLNFGAVERFSTWSSARGGKVVRAFDPAKKFEPM
jgi:hypothetical protein